MTTDTDEILEEWEVFVGTELTPFLHLCPFSSTTLANRFNAVAEPDTIRFKNKARRFEACLPIMDLKGNNLSEERVRELNVTAGQKISGAAWPWMRVQYLLGRFSTDGNLFMTPVESMIPLNASLGHLDEFDTKLKAQTVSATTTYSNNNNSSSFSFPNTPSTATNPSAASTTAAPGTKAIQVQFRKKETEEQVQARLNSYAHLQRQIDDEPWANLKHFSPKSPEIDAVKDKLVSQVRGPLEFVSGEDYLDKVINYTPPVPSQ